MGTYVGSGWLGAGHLQAVLCFRCCLKELYAPFHALPCFMSFQVRVSSLVKISSNLADGVRQHCKSTRPRASPLGAMWKRQISLLKFFYGSTCCRQSMTRLRTYLTTLAKVLILPRRPRYYQNHQRRTVRKWQSTLTGWTANDTNVGWC